MNATHNVLGNGSRANATIGRALRLLIINVLGGIPGQLDRSTLGHPGKFTFCLAEDEEDSPWLPLAAERGMPAGRLGRHGAGGRVPAPGHERVDARSAGHRRDLRGGHPRQHADLLDLGGELRRSWSPSSTGRSSPRPGWSKKDLRECVHERARVTRREWRTVGKSAVAPRKDEDAVYTALRSPDDLLVVAAGGPAGGFGAILPPWYGRKSLAVTKGIDG